MIFSGAGRDVLESTWPEDLVELSDSLASLSYFREVSIPSLEVATASLSLSRFASEELLIVNHPLKSPRGRKGILYDFTS